MEIDIPEPGTERFKSYCQENNITDLMLLVNCVNSNENIDIIKKILQNPKQINQRNMRGMSALMMVRNIDVLQILLNANADINLRDKNGTTPLMWMCRENNRDIGIIRALISAGADVNIRRNDGLTALSCYICYNYKINKELLELLIIKSNITITIPDIYDLTPYDYYMSNKHFVLDEYFVKVLKGDISLSNTKSAITKH